VSISSRREQALEKMSDGCTAFLRILVERFDLFCRFVNYEQLFIKRPPVLTTLRIILSLQTNLYANAFVSETWKQDMF